MSDQQPNLAGAPAEPIVNAAAPVIYADHLLGAGVSQGNVTLTFGMRQFDHGLNPPAATRQVCLRLVLPAAAAAELAQFVGQMVQRGPAGANGD
ncbi:MAG: hypothetical protein KGL12_12305 [Rhodospirillales bacterium]|nr:hypothetical protein [Rhodospirillales bacterium]